MTIHVVQSGETIESIAKLYGASVERLILENGILNPDDLVVGQTIVIIKPLQSYTIQQGDTLVGIAEMFDVSIKQILRNNPYLSNREYIYPGESLVISYDTEKIDKIVVGGYISSFVDKDVLRKTLPFLTIVTVHNYRVDQFGKLNTLDDQEIVYLAKSFGVIPMIMISTFSEQGIDNREIMKSLLTDKELQDRFIDHVLNVIKEKGYCGVNQYIQINDDNKNQVEELVIQMSTRLKSEGFRYSLTLSPKTNFDRTDISYEQLDISTISKYTDALLILSYDWGYSVGPPAPITPVNLLSTTIEEFIKVAPSNEFGLGLPVIGYDWPLPYIPGYTMANAITYDTAIQIALENGVSIQYDEISQSPYYFYTKANYELHNVWFKDARSIDTITRLVPKYGLQGISVWNNMFFFTQMWFLINNLYEIEEFSCPINQPLET